ncbi:MAG: hypothetical protein MJA83_03410 [Gammaproteobacteria bacterium]|nr:hypothetical protein [Gammaproteobacteria bacterium]
MKVLNDRASLLAAESARRNRKTPSTYGGNCRGRPCYYLNKSGEDLYLRSSLELSAAIFFDLEGIQYLYEPWKLDIEGATDYVPDFFLQDLGIYVEVKHSSYAQRFLNEKLPRISLDYPLELMTEDDFPQSPKYEAYDDIFFEEIVN